jgi:hypothetical protein
MPQLPKLPLADWEDTKNTLHLFMQIVGKIRMTLHPKSNHWWHVPLYVCSRGLTTRPIPAQGMLFEIQLDFCAHRLSVSCSSGATEEFALTDLSVAAFYTRLMQALARIGVEVRIKAEPYDLPFSTLPFAEDEVHASYDAQAVETYFTLLRFVEPVFEQFRGRFVGKSTPVHLFWHHMDLALTRFSGKAAPLESAATNADREAYSHEVISFGFWTGDADTPQPAFYAYVYPEPPGLAQQPLVPAAARWNAAYGYAQAFLSWEDLRVADDPTADLLAFLEGCYQLMAGANSWDLEALALPGA